MIPDVGADGFGVTHVLGMVGGVEEEIGPCHDRVSVVDVGVVHAHEGDGVVGVGVAADALHDSVEVGHVALWRVAMLCGGGMRLGRRVRVVVEGDEGGG